MGEDLVNDPEEQEMGGWPRVLRPGHRSPGLASLVSFRR